MSRSATRPASEGSRWREFGEARAYVRTQRLGSRSEWDAWLKRGERPPDIPANPYAIYKNSGWVNWGDWLGTGAISPRDRVYRPFEDARVFVRALRLGGVDDWYVWVTSGEKPEDIPASPSSAYKNRGWVSWGDWLGTGAIASFNRVFRPFEEARAYVRTQGIKSQSEWHAWLKKGERPADIPADPQRVYEDRGWVNWGDWLGTRRIATQERAYRPFKDARTFVRAQGLRNQREWNAWRKTGEKPEDIPSNPNLVYGGDGWVSWGDWLGTGAISPRNRVYRPFEEARAYVRSQGLENMREWRAWVKAGKKPDDIPSAPQHTYKDRGWVSWGDWLGTGMIAPQNRIYRSFEDARAHVQAQGLGGVNDWYAWATSGEKPADIPRNPDQVYKDCGWNGYQDWLGVVNRWSRAAIVTFLQDLLPRLPGLSPMVLFEIMRQNGMLAASREYANSNRQFLADIVQSATGGDHAGLAAHIAAALASVTPDHGTAAPTSDHGTAAPTVEPDDEITDVIIPPHDATTALDAALPTLDAALPTLDAPTILAAVDYAALVCPGADEEAVEFFIADAVGQLWQAHLRDEGTLDLAALRDYPAGEYASVVRARFLEQLEGAEALHIPDGYNFRDKNGQLVAPNLMQRLVAYRLKTEQRLGNWSGTGAGKTLAAILASRVVDAHLTVVIGLNNTLDGWKQEILKTFPDSTVLVKERGTLEIDAAAHTFLLLNFEALQQPNSSSMVRRLVEDHPIDLMVLDEVHSAKQRDAVASKRRQVLLGLLTLAAQANADLHVLGMSATPVINTLSEAKSLLEMVQGVTFPELETRPTIPNVVAIHQKLVVHGVRYRPQYTQVLTERCVAVPGNHLLSALRGVGPGDVLGIERVLLEAKLDTIVAETRPGTLIYTHYIEGIVPRLREALTIAGFSVAEFTGDDKSGFERFKRGAVDVLLGSSTLGTGVDGLQKVCNRLIVATPPWTSAGYEQLVGRIYRQGAAAAFTRVDVIIPQVVIGTEDGEWSWDVQRHDRIRYKKTLADAAVDGVIPEGVLEPPAALLARALNALRAWIARIEGEGLAPSVERARLEVPLPADVRRTAQRTFGDFATMNARLYAAHSATTHKRLAEDPAEWYLYHTLYREARKDWPEVPYERFVRWLSARPHLVVGDFGCGEALLAASLPNTVHSFDHVAVNEGVIACDMAHTPLEDGVLDVAIFSLSLMGTNVKDYLKEAHRVLKLDGRLRIAEKANRWQDEKRAELLTMIRGLGFQLIGTVEERDRFLYIDALKG